MESILKFFLWRFDPIPAQVASRSLIGYTTVGRTPLDEWSARHRDLTTHNTHNSQTSTPQAEFEPTRPASERPQTHASDRVATAIGIW